MIKNAIELAARVHHNQFRKGTDIPYIAHPCNVGVILAQNGCSEEIITAGVLHDVIEDTSITFDDLRQQFGKKVASLVEKCSEPDKLLPWRERKQHTIEYLAKAPLDVKFIACADKLDNIISIDRDYHEHGEEFWLRFNAGKERQRWYYYSLVNSFRKGKFSKSSLFAYFEEKVYDIFDVPNPWAAEPDLSDYHYYDKDGAIFRKRENGGAEGVDDVKTSDGWKPYQGDCIAPVFFGDRISEEEACRD